MDRKLWERMIKINPLKEYNEDKPSEIDGKKKQQAKNYIYKKMGTLTNHIYRDDHWKAVQEFWKILDKMNIKWWIEKSAYKKNKDDIPYKEWLFNIYYHDGKKYIDIKGTVTAHGAGSVKDPLDRYDITVVMW